METLQAFARWLFGERTKPHNRIFLELEEYEQRLLCAASVWSPQSGPGIPNWGIAENWVPMGVPDASTSVEIPAGVGRCNVNGTQFAASVIVAADALLSIGQGNHLMVGGSFVNSGEVSVVSGDLSAAGVWNVGTMKLSAASIFCGALFTNTGNVEIAQVNPGGLGSSVTGNLTNDWSAPQKLVQLLW